MTGDSVHIDADLHTPSLAAVNAAVSRLCGDDEFRTDFVFIDDVLPAEAVAVFFLDGSGYKDRILVAEHA